MISTIKGGRPKADPRAVEAWLKYRPTAAGKLALAAGVSQPAVSKWRQVPEKRLAAVAKFLGREPYELRPDLHSDPFSLLNKENA